MPSFLAPNDQSFGARVSRFATAFRPLRHRNYQLWFFGQGLSLVGTWMQSMAQQVLVYRLTGSASALGIVSFMTVLPLIPCALWGGSISDRFPKRTVLLATQTLMMVQAFLLASLTWSGTIKIWHIYLMSFMLGALKAFDMPARQSFIVEMVGGKEDLTSAIGLNSAIHNSAKTLGPALAGVAIAALGEAVAFFINGISFLAVILSLLAMRNLPRISKEQLNGTSIVVHTVEGIRYVLGQQTLLILMSLVAISSFLSKPYQTLMPVFANLMLENDTQPIVAFFCSGTQPLLECQTPEAIPLGLLLSSVGTGALMGALIAASLPKGAKRGRWLTIGNLSFPFLLLIFVVSRSVAVSMFVMVLVGVSHVLQNAMANTLLQITSPDQLRGRVMSQYALVSQGMTHVGGLQVGFVADWIGAPLSVGIGASVSLLYGLFIALRYTKVRNLG